MTPLPLSHYRVAGAPNDLAQRVADLQRAVEIQHIMDIYRSLFPSMTKERAA